MFDEIQDTINQLSVIIKEQKTDFKRILDERKTIEFWVEEGKRLNIEKYENELKRNNINRNKSKIVSCLSFAQSILKELKDKEDNKNVIGLLEEYLDI